MSWSDSSSRSRALRSAASPSSRPRSIKHCMTMGHGRMSCERKMDGEYAQIHIDLSKSLDNCIQIFSKSGKDSTKDRIKLHEYGSRCPPLLPPPIGTASYAR